MKLFAACAGSDLPVGFEETLNTADKIISSEGLFDVLENVTVYSSVTCEYCDNCDNCKSVVSYARAGTFDFYRTADIAAELNCDGGIFLWDGSDLRIRQCIVDLLVLRKQVTVFLRSGELIAEREKLLKLLFGSPRKFDIWLDDVRTAPDGFTMCRSVGECIMLIEYAKSRNIPIDIIDCDHDLGDYAPLGGDGIKLIEYLAESGKKYKIALHTANPVGRANMQAIIERYDICYLNG